MTTRPKRLIQVPIDDELLTRVDTGASVVRESRAEFVRQACEQRLKKLKDLAKDQQYEAGYAQIPRRRGLGQGLCQGARGPAAPGEVVDAPRRGLVGGATGTGRSTAGAAAEP